MHALARKIGIVERLDERLHLLTIHRPYHESDHVLNFALNVLAGGPCIEGLELRRNDEVFFDALGTERIPDPTTAGDFCQRFTADDVPTLMDLLGDTRLEVWRQQPSNFFDQAVLDLDGTWAPTTGPCQEERDISYKGTWGYPPLKVSLAGTGEMLRIVNRSGNRPSHAGAPREVDRPISLCQRGGFRRILLRGDTDFTQTKHLDRWDAIAGVPFLFGRDVQPSLPRQADDLPEAWWEFLERPQRYEVRLHRSIAFAVH